MVLQISGLETIKNNRAVQAGQLSLLNLSGNRGEKKTTTLVSQEQPCIYIVSSCPFLLTLDSESH